MGRWSMFLPQEVPLHLVDQIETRMPASKYTYSKMYLLGSEIWTKNGSFVLLFLHRSIQLALYESGNVSSLLFLFLLLVLLLFVSIFCCRQRWMNRYSSSSGYDLYNRSSLIYVVVHIHHWFPFLLIPLYLGTYILYIYNSIYTKNTEYRCLFWDHPCRWEHVLWRWKPRPNYQYSQQLHYPQSRNINQQSYHRK